jgi:hypothetical protein
MNLVSWNSAIQIKVKPTPENLNTADKLWYDVTSPSCYEELVGNEHAVRETENWFREASFNPRASSCLFVHGESGTGKSTAVSMIAKKHHFQTVTTYADRSRTPARLEGVVREAGVHGSRGVVVLDDFEIFLSETTSLRVLSKLLRQLLNPGHNHGSRHRCLFIIISNSKHKLFGSLQDISTIVRFERLQPQEIHKVFNRLASRVRHHSYVPPMATYLSSLSSSGTITQGVQQLQLLFSGNKMAKFVHRPRRKKQKQDQGQIANTTNNNRDCISYLWADIYTDRILDHLVDDQFQPGRMIDRLVGFERGRLDTVGAQLHDEYARRMTSMDQLRGIADVISMSDTNRIENHEDGLYDGENRDSWSASDIAFVSFVAYGVVAIKGQTRKDAYWSRKSHTRLLKCQPLIM